MGLGYDRPTFRTLLKFLLYISCYRSWIMALCARITVGLISLRALSMICNGKMVWEEAKRECDRRDLPCFLDWSSGLPFFWSRGWAWFGPGIASCCRTRCLTWWTVGPSSCWMSTHLVLHLQLASLQYLQNLHLQVPAAERIPQCHLSAMGETLACSHSLSVECPCRT